MSRRKFSIFIALLTLATQPLFALTQVKKCTQSAIQEAIDKEYKQGGGIVLLPTGIYDLRGSICMKENVQLMGRGSQTILKKCTQHTTEVKKEIAAGSKKVYVKKSKEFKEGDHFMLVYEGFSNETPWIGQVASRGKDYLTLKEAIPFNVPLSTHPFVVSAFPCIQFTDAAKGQINNLHIHGNSSENPSQKSFQEASILVNNSPDCKIKGVVITDSPAEGITISQSNGALIEECQMHHLSKAAIRLTNCDAATVKECTLAQAIVMAQSKEVVIEGCKIEGCPSTAVSIQSCEGCKVRESRFALAKGTNRRAHSTADALFISKSNNVLVEKTTFQHSHRSAIRLDHCKEPHVRECLLIDSGIADPSGDALYLGSHTQSGLFENNVIEKNHRAAISIGDHGSYHDFVSNVLRGNDTGVLFRGDCCKTQQNVFRNTLFAQNRRLDLMMQGPTCHLYIDNWPEKYSIHNEARHLYLYENSKRRWRPIRK